MTNPNRTLQHSWIKPAAIAGAAFIFLLGCRGPQDRATADAWLKTVSGTSNHSVEGPLCQHG